MRKRICIVLAACLMLTGCGDKEESSDVVLTPQTTIAAAEESVQAPEVVTEEAEPVMTAEVTTPAPVDTAEPTEENDTAETSESGFDKYAELIMGYDNTYLGLPQKDKVYIFAGTGETAELDGMTCHGVSCYDEHEGTLYYMCDFYISQDGASVYRYYVSDDRYSLLPEASTFPALDPGTQTPEEIFAVANELYGYFTRVSLPYFSGMTMEAEVDGTQRTYYMVSDERLDTKAELLEALGGYFSMDIINGLMDSSIYREGMDGKLYTTGGEREIKPYYVGTEYELTVLNGDAAEFTAYTTYGGEDDTVLNVTEYVYMAVKSDGRWFFTNFELPY